MFQTLGFELVKEKTENVLSEKYCRSNLYGYKVGEKYPVSSKELH